ILAEIHLPPLPVVGMELDPRRLAEDRNIGEKMPNEYAGDSPTFEEIQKSPDKYAKEHQFRVAVVEAILEIRKLANDLPLTFRDPITAAVLNEIAMKHQRSIAERQNILVEARERLEEAAKNRAQEKSKRWQAHFDYVQAQTDLRLAWISEYNLMLGH